MDDVCYRDSQLLNINWETNIDIRHVKLYGSEAYKETVIMRERHIIIVSITVIWCHLISEIQTLKMHLHPLCNASMLSLHLTIFWSKNGIKKSSFKYERRFRDELQGK